MATMKAEKKKGTVIVVSGIQWGDEGKGKVIDQESQEADLIVRHGGGNNTGHTVMVADIFNGGQQIPMVLHLLPSAVARRKAIAIGAGVVVDPLALVNEVDYVSSFGYGEVRRTLSVDPRTALVTVIERVMDMAQELIRSRNGKPIGTTARGIGPAYAGVANRTALKVADLLHPKQLCTLLEQRLEEATRLFRAMGITSTQWRQIFADLTGMELRANQRLIERKLRTEADFDYTVFASANGKVGFNFAAIEAAYQNAAHLITSWRGVRDVSDLIRRTVMLSGRVLLEGAQGAMLDVNFGSWPNVTSSHTLAGGACTGLGIGPTLIDTSIGVAKGYTTRVGSGPLPTRITEPEIAASIHQRGNEFGASTGRPRDVGWFDAVIARSACWWNLVQTVRLLKLDVLSGLDEIKICFRYCLNGERFYQVPADYHQLNDSGLEPEYLTLPGWEQDISKVRRWRDLPKEVKGYVAKIEQLLNERLPQRVTIDQIGIGPGPDQYLTR